MIVNEISLVIQKIFSVKQPKDQRFKELFLSFHSFFLCYSFSSFEEFLETVDGFVLNINSQVMKEPAK